MELTSSNVEATIRACFFDNERAATFNAEAPPEDCVVVRGLVQNFGFQRDRLEAQRENVASMLSQLPDEFDEGWSFLQLPSRKDGVLWGQHHEAEALLCMGIGLGLMVMLAPREMWPILPGGVPYVQRTLETA